MKTILTLIITFDHEMQTEELQQSAHQIFKHLEREYNNCNFCITAEVSHKEDITNG